MAPESEDERLIFAVQARPVLYDPRNRHYHKQNIREKAWEEVITETGIADAKVRWKALRDRYVKEAKLKASGTKVKNSRPWELLSCLQFLDEHIKHRGPVLGPAAVVSTTTTPAAVVSTSYVDAATSTDTVLGLDLEVDEDSSSDDDVCNGGGDIELLLRTVMARSACGAEHS